MGNSNLEGFDSHLDDEDCVNDDGYFIVYENDKEQFDIKVEINTKKTDNPPKEFIELYSNVEAASAIIKSLNKTEESIKRKYFNKLLSLAQAGLVSSSANPELAEASLIRLKEEIVIIEGRRIKNNYMKVLGIYALVIAAISLIVYETLQILNKYDELAALMLLGTGTMLGTWVSFGARKMDLKFEELSVIEKDMMQPFIRLIYIYLSAIVMALFLMTGIVQLKVGTLDATNMISDYKVPLLVGIICGLVESRIGVKVYKHANNIIGSDE